MGAEAGSSFAVYPIGSRHVTANWFVAVSNWITGAGGGARVGARHRRGPGFGFPSRPRVDGDDPALDRAVRSQSLEGDGAVVASLGTKTRLNEPKAADRPSDRSESPSSTELDRSDHDADDADDDDDDDPAAE